LKKYILLIPLLVILGVPKYTEASVPMVASWYECCKITANGEKFNPNGHTAAHKTLPFGTKLRVTYKNKSLIVRINDRGPFIKGRSLDLARGAAMALGCKGVCRVKIAKVN
jgi:rare lipoprotein A